MTFYRRELKAGRSVDAEGKSLLGKFLNVECCERDVRQQKIVLMINQLNRFLRFSDIDFVSSVSSCRRELESSEHELESSLSRNHLLRASKMLYEYSLEINPTVFNRSCL